MAINQNANVVAAEVRRRTKHYTCCAMYPPTWRGGRASKQFPLFRSAGTGRGFQEAHPADSERTRIWRTEFRSDL